MNTIPLGWESMRLANFIELQRGFDLPASARVPGDVKVLSAGGVHGTHSESRVEGPGFVIGRVTNLGFPTWSDEDFWPLNTTLFAKDFKGNEPKFAYYWFQSKDLTGFNSGSVQPTLNRNYIADVQVLRPPVNEQRRIAAVLTLLDDKIESNRRAITICRDLAHALFKAANKEKHVATDVLKPVLGGTPSRKESTYWDGNIPWASAKDIAASDGGYVLETAENITQEGVAHSAAKVLPKGSIVITARGTVGALARLGHSMAFNQSCYGLQAKDVSESVLFLAVQSAINELKSAAHGTVFSTVNMATFQHLDLFIPTEAKIINQIEALFDVMEQKTREISLLHKLRDALLPELLSGRIQVSEDGKLIFPQE